VLFLKGRQLVSKRTTKQEKKGTTPEPRGIAEVSRESEALLQAVVADTLSFFGVGRAVHEAEVASILRTAGARVAQTTASLKKEAT
jgi:hypothetical protein